VQRWPQGHGRRCFASEASAAQAPPGEASELMEVPLAQTGEGIAECELLRWFVAEVRARLHTGSIVPFCCSELCSGDMGHKISFVNRDIVLFPCCLCNLLHVHGYLLLGKKIGTFRKSFDSSNLNS